MARQMPTSLLNLINTLRVLEDFGGELVLLHLTEVFSKGLHFPIDRQVLQQVTVKDIKILFVQGLFEVETCNVDSLTVERHLLQLLI